MKRIILAAFCLLCISVKAQTNYPTGISNCVARWNFTSAASISSVPDVSGNNNNAIPYNLTTANGFRNASNKAMQFNGTNSYARVTDNTTLRPQKISMLALVNLDTFYTGICQNIEVVGKGTSTFISGKYGIDISDNIYDNNDCFSYDPNHMQLIPALHGASYPIPAGNYISLHKWYLFLVTYDSATVNEYQILMDTNNYISNVLPVVSAVINIPLDTNTDDVTIGRMDNSQYPYWLNGKLDEVALFSKALNNSEVQDVYDYLWGKVVINKPFADTTVCAGGVINVPYSVSDNFPTNNLFMVQLSSATGSFSNPVVVGTLASNISGNIVCTIPPNIPPGNGYRVRIVPSNPLLTSRDNGKNIQVAAPGTAGVLISASPSNIVTGQPITFTAFVNNGGTTTTYNWKKNGLSIPGATSNPYITSSIYGNDTVSVVIHSNASCISPDSAESNKITMIATSIDHVFALIPDLVVYPNPSNGDFSIKGNLLKNADLWVEILNSLGQTIATEKMNLRKGMFEKAIFIGTEFPAGLYLIQVSDGNQSKAIPVIVHR